MLGNGGFDAPESVFDLPAHAAFGDFTPLALLAAVLVVLAATVTWLLRRRRAVPVGR